MSVYPNDILASAISSVASVLNKIDYSSTGTSQLDIAKAALSKNALSIEPLDQPHYAPGHKYTYHRYKDPVVSAGVKALETKIGQTLYSGAFAPLGGLAASLLIQPLRPILNLIPGGSMLFSTLGLTGSGALLSLFKYLNQKEQLKNFLIDKYLEIAGPPNLNKKNVQALHMLTRDPASNKIIDYSNMDETRKAQISELIEGLRTTFGSSITQLSHEAFPIIKDTNTVTESPDLERYAKIRIPENIVSANITYDHLDYVNNDAKFTGRSRGTKRPRNPLKLKADFMRAVIAKAGMTPVHANLSDREFVHNKDNQWGFENAVRIFNAEHCVAKGLFEAIKRDIKTKCMPLINEINAYRMYDTTLVHQFRTSVRRPIMDHITRLYGDRKDIIDAVDALLRRELSHIRAENKHKLN
ncbi:MAG: hypothetical protein AAF621_02030 [Pseudomonadota bacterium]